MVSSSPDEDEGEDVDVKPARAKEINSSRLDEDGVAAVTTTFFFLPKDFAGPGIAHLFFLGQEWDGWKYFFLEKK